MNHFPDSWNFVAATKEAEHIEEKTDSTENRGGKSYEQDNIC